MLLFFFFYVFAATTEQSSPKGPSGTKKTRDRENKQEPSNEDSKPKPRSTEGGESTRELREAAHIGRLRTREDHFQVREGGSRRRERLEVSRHALRYGPLGCNREDTQVATGQNRAHRRAEQWRIRRGLYARQLAHKVNQLVTAPTSNLSRRDDELEALSLRSQFRVFVVLIPDGLDEGRAVFDVRVEAPHS